ncbi:MAG TPA: hypothetical protein VFV37_08245 [Luteibaculaceae bacterium]|nr:hypothetical protein [Luteibaculaceae bacterium]
MTKIHPPQGLAILVADSGSTKTDWHYVSALGDVKSLQTEGLNPVFSSSDEMREVAVRVANFIGQSSEQLTVFFYGAGCGTPDRQSAVVEIMKMVWPNALIEVSSDMLGAARALLGKSNGLAAILGTGMNTCLYENGKITHSLPSLGFIMGDEGGGAFLGKHLIADYLAQRLPDSLHRAFEHDYPYRYADIIHAVYREPRPNRFLAQFVPFIGINREAEYIKLLLNHAFTSFFETQIIRYPNYHEYPLALCGSVAFHFQREIQEVAVKYDFKTISVVGKPIEALAQYHLSTQI